MNFYPTAFDKKQNRGLFLFACFSCLLMVSCHKENPICCVIGKPEDSAAVFQLVTSDSACTAPLLAGSFIAGKPVGNSESIKMEVSVSKVGTWSISTNTLNNFAFAGSGNFTDTGRQFIELKASGTPAIVGNYFFSITTEAIQRIFPVSVLTGNVQTETVPLKSYFKGNIGGVAYYVEAPTIGPDNIPYGSGGDDTAVVVSFVTTNIYPPPPNSGSVSMQKGFFYGYTTNTEAEFKKFFEPGAYPISPTYCPYYLFPGIVFTWVDSNGEAWQTLRELGDQQGSSFTIVGIEDGHDNRGIYFVKVKSRFNFKLYNHTTGEMKELTDGELVSYFKK